MAQYCREVLYKDISPAVINHDMLMKAIDEQRPSGEAGRLAREDGINLDEVTELRLEFLNILRIDYLWVLTGLTKLSLSNNMIEKIENLNELVNVTVLDLSFNEIEVIENLGELVNLEVLTLYNNRITEIKNLKTLKKLHVFSIGRNNISDRETIFHLRTLKQLRSVNMAENPCALNSDFRIFIATFLPQIMYYEYKRIMDNERECGHELFGQLLKEVVVGEAAELAEEQRIEDERLEAEMHGESFIEFLGGRQLFDSLYEKDVEGKLLLQIPEVEDLYHDYETSFLEVTRKLFEAGQARYHTRKIEVQQFLKCVETAKEENQVKCQIAMDEFMDKKKMGLKEIKDKRASYEQNGGEIDYVSDAEFMQKLIDELNETMHFTWKLLMGLEMALFDQLEETNLNFERSLTDLVSAFIEEAQGFFTQLRGFESAYMETVFEATNKLVAAYAEKTSYIPEDLIPLCEDKELQNNTVAASHDMHMILIDSREDRLVTRAKLWLQTLVNNLYKNEIGRNRGKVLEINHFLDCQRDELEELYFETPGLNADITAALAV